jgi:hypothetical protein
MYQEVSEEAIDSSRGNRPYSSQHLRPTWLSKEGYLDFANMRAFPHLELRKLCDVLLKKTLPLDEESVRLLVRQVVYYIGKLGIFDGKVSMCWRQDFGHSETNIAFFQVLKHLAATLKERPHNFEACQLVGELSCYFSSYSPLPFKEVVGRFLAKSVMKWIDSYEEEISSASPVDIFTFRSKQVMYSYVSILCVVGGAINDEDAWVILKNIVLSRNMFVEDDDEAQKRRDLRTTVAHFLSSNTTSYHTCLGNNKNLLTKATRTIIESCPIDLEWERLADSTCFEAVYTNGDIYSLNPLKGVVLLNGLPPSHLPASISESDLFKAVFGENRFEVIRKDDIYETVRRVQGCYYRFCQNDCGLVIQESSLVQNYDDCWDETLELLDFTTIDEWGKNLPPKLRFMYSHWVSRKRSLLLFRPFAFDSRKPSYIYTIDRGECRKVSKFRKVDDWLGLLDDLNSMDELILHESQFTRVVERLERRDFMHTYSLGERDNAYVLNIYRFGLNFRFELGGDFFSCQEVAGYRLSDQQHLRGTLHGLRQYLVLTACDCSKVTTKIIVPDGDIVANHGGFVTINGKDSVKDIRKGYIYDLHPRFGYLIAHNISARFHLAGIHVATSLYVPDSSLGKTGEERALELLRECWVNRPFSDEEYDRLSNVMKLSQGSCSSLYLRCLELKRSAEEFTFLHRRKSKVLTLTALSPNESVAYCDRKSRQESNPRLHLSSSEEYRTIGMIAPVFSNTHLMECEKGGMMPNEMKCPKLDLNHLSTTLAGFYTTLREYWEYDNQLPQCSISNTLPFPRSDNTPLEHHTYDELLSSWSLYCETKRSGARFTDQFKSNKNSCITSIQSKISKVLKSTENHLFTILSGDNFKNDCKHGLSFKRLANIVPTATKSDLARCACFPAYVKNFNPTLCEASREEVVKTIITWLELCVLEDKVKALKSHLGSGDDRAMLMELKNEREWNTIEHPYWLVFEVEQKIRIRPEQYKVAQHLIDNPGHIVQLNMGLGKTRVILPMLVLHYSFSTGSVPLTRIHILSALLNEAFAYFHNALCASVLNRKIFCFPFDRSIDLSIDQAESIRDMLAYCRHERGFVLVSPESRLSLELRSKEILMLDHQEDANSDLKLSRILDDIIGADWQDVFDEVDEILHHRYQLIYAIGNEESFPQGSHRWEACQILLQTVIATYIPGVTVDHSENGNFPPVTLDKHCDEKVFRNEVVNALIENPPCKLQWIRDFQSESNGASIIKDIKLVLTNPGADPSKLLRLTEEHLHDILALRGFLAYDLLIHCLMKRHRVNYGVKVPGKKRIAVPFRGADTPSERSEFSHPDCAIGLTTLAYYYSGLTDNQMKEALVALLKRGENAKRVIYDGWFESVRSRMSDADIQSIDSINKIDLSNKSQVGVLTHYYKKI